MLVKIFGGVYIIMAIWLLMNAYSIKEWLKRVKGARFLSLITLANIVVILGAMALLKGVMFLIPSVCEKIMDWALQLPTIMYRIGAFFHIAIGVLLMSLK